MPTKPRTVPPQFKYPFWVEEPKGFYHSEKTELERAVKATGLADSLIQNRMGAGFHYLADALAGKRLNRWAIAHIEYALRPITEDEQRYLPAQPGSP